MHIYIYTEIRCRESDRLQIFLDAYWMQHIIINNIRFLSPGIRRTEAVNYFFHANSGTRVKIKWSFLQGNQNR